MNPITWLNGRKTTIGSISLILWVAIYAMPAFGDYNILTNYAIQIRDFLNTNGVQLDNSLFNTGAGFTVIGLIDKVRKLFIIVDAVEGT